MTRPRMTDYRSQHARVLEEMPVLREYRGSLVWPTPAPPLAMFAQILAEAITTHKRGSGAMNAGWFELTNTP